MNIFKRLFGRKSQSQSASAAPQPVPEVRSSGAAPTAAKVDPASDPKMIRVYDQFGRELFMTRQQWRENVLPGALKREWNNADQLYNIIVGALSDGFRAEVVKAAKHLYEIDPVRSRGACLWGVVLTEEGRLDEAEKVFGGFLSKNGEDGYILTNLAKVYAKRRDDRKTEETLWRGLEVDPNQDNGLAWYVSRYQERGGKSAALEAYHRVAALPGSWRAQLWLAREALASSQWQQAVEYYQQGLSRAGKPTPADLLMQMSGDMGNHGQLVALLKLTAPHFDAAAHGLIVGNNLIKAHVELGELDEAKHLIDTLYAQKRPDWAQTLQFWESEVAKKRLNLCGSTTNAPHQMTMLTIDGPVWMPEGSPAAALFDRVGNPDVPVVCFLGSSAETGQVANSAILQQSTDPGRMSRALPLFLCEQTDLHTRSHGRALIPFILRPAASFVLAGKDWEAEDGAQMAREGTEPADYLVLTHLVTTSDRWRVIARLIRTIDGTCLEQWEQEFDPHNPEETFGMLVSQVQAGLQQHAGIEPVPSGSIYRVPGGSHFAHYLLRLEQLLAVRCARIEGVGSEFLVGEREIIQGNLQLCLDCPQLIIPRIVLMQTVASLNKVKPGVVREYRDKLVLLQKEKPLAEPAQGIVQSIADEVMAI